MKDENKILNNSLKKLVTRFGREDFVSSIVKNSSKEDITKLPIRELVDSHYLKKAKLDDVKITQAKKQMNNGFYDPIIVRSYQNKYEVVVGRVKFYAAKELKLDFVDVVVLNLTDEETLLFMLKEIKDRKTINIYELSLICNNLKNTFNYKNKELCDYLDQSSSQISNLLQIINLPQEVLAEISMNQISYGHAKAISRLPEEDLLRVFNEIKEKHLSVRETEELVRKIKKVEVKKEEKIEEVIEEKIDPLKMQISFLDEKSKKAAFKKLKGLLKKNKVVIK